MVMKKRTAARVGVGGHEEAIPAAALHLRLLLLAALCLLLVKKKKTRKGWWTWHR